MQNEKSVGVALIDLDGTIADYDRAMDRELRRIWSPQDPPLTRELLSNAPDWLDARIHLVRSKAGFWRNLELLEVGMEVVQLIRNAGFSLHVLTKGPHSVPSAWSEKLEWAHHYLPDAKVTVTEDYKGMTYGRILFDDWPQYKLAWLEHRPRGLGLMLDQPWNQGFSHPQVIRIRGREDFGAVTTALIQQADRSEG